MDKGNKEELSEGLRELMIAIQGLDDDRGYKILIAVRKMQETYVAHKIEIMQQAAEMIKKAAEDAYNKGLEDGASHVLRHQEAYKDF